MILHELFRVLSRFPRYISCYIAEQCIVSELLLLSNCYPLLCNMPILLMHFFRERRLLCREIVLPPSRGRYRMRDFLSKGTFYDRGRFMTGDVLSRGLFIMEDILSIQYRDVS